MAAGALRGTHDVSLACRSDVVGSRVAVPGQRLPFLAPFDPLTYTRLVGMVRQTGADVLIPTKRRDYLMAGLAARQCRRHCVLRVGIVRRLPDTPWHRVIYGSLAHGIIVNARAVKDALVASPFVAPGKVEVVYNGLDTAAMRRSVCVPAPFTVTVVWAGKLTPRKEPGVLIDALALLVQRDGRADLGAVLLGEGPLRPTLERQAAALGVGDRVRFAGFVNDPYPVLASAQIYVTTSRNEGLSNALLEGMSLTGAVIATRAGGSEEAVRDGENGFVVDHGDAAALAERIARLADDEALRRRFGERARQTVTTQFDMTAMRDGLTAFLARICAE